MLSSFATKTITRLRYPSTTDQGVTVPDYTATPAEASVGGCWYEPVTSSEDMDGRDAVGTGYTVAAPAGVDVLSTDRLRIEGDVYEIVGAPLSIPSPTGALASTKIVTRRWEG